MAPPVYSIEFVSADNPGSGGISVGPPDGFKWIIRDITGLIRCNSGGPGWIRVYQGGVNIYYVEIPALTVQAFHVEPRIVIENGNDFTVDSGGAASHSFITVSGYQLSIP